MHPGNRPRLQPTSNLSLRDLAGAFALLLAAVLAGCGDRALQGQAHAADATGIESAAIDFALPDLDGHTVRLSDWRGQWVLVNYWATWCAPCRKEIPDFSALHERRDDITVLGLAFEENDVATFREFLVDYPATYPILQVDVYNPPAALGAPLALPTSYLIDPGGRLVETWVGPVTGAQVEARIDSGS